jgi:hypothetical protein
MMTQKEAQERNWKIRQLRGIWSMLQSFDCEDDLKAAAQDKIDTLLIFYGAEPEFLRRQRPVDENYIQSLNYDTR